MVGNVVEMVVGWDRTGERGGPAPGPGRQMNPGCPPNDQAGSFSRLSSAGETACRGKVLAEPNKVQQDEMF